VFTRYSRLKFILDGETRCEKPMNLKLQKVLESINNSVNNGEAVSNLSNPFYYYVAELGIAFDFYDGYVCLD
jgi:hypothetical protein